MRVFSLEKNRQPSFFKKYLILFRILTTKFEQRSESSSELSLSFYHPFLSKIGL